MRKLLVPLLAAGLFPACQQNPTVTGSATTEAVPVQTTPMSQAGREASPGLQNSRPLALDGEFTRPAWSPDGRRLLLTKGGGNTGLYIADPQSSGGVIQLNDLPGAGYGAAWSSDSKKIFYRQKENFKMIVRSVDVSSKEAAAQHGVSCELQSYAMTQAEGPLLSINLKTFKVEAADPKTGRQWIVTTAEGQFYQPLLSPDRTKVVAHSGSKMLVFHADGSGLFSNLGEGIATSWSPDSKFLLAFYDESSDGHTVTNSELYLLKADGSSRRMLTNTNDIVEMYPSWNPVSNRVAFADDRTGKIFIAELILPE